MLKVRILNWLCAAAIGLTIVAFAPDTTFAAGDTPAPEPKPKPKPKTKPKPKPKESSLNQEQIYSLGYWQAKGGAYDAALATLRSAANQTDPRIQTMIGFSLRKLGRVEEAMDRYQKVLALYPERTNTRQYLGEAFLQIGELGKAKEELAEIAKRCGAACEDYQSLADEITQFENTAG